MRIDKFKFLKILGKHFTRKVGGGVNHNETDLTLMASSLAPMFNAYASRMKSSEVLDHEERIHIERLEEEVNKFFAMVPVINCPLNGTTLTITKRDVEAFIKDLYLYADVEQDEVIYLPYQN